MVLFFLSILIFSQLEYTPSGDGKELTINTKTEITNKKIKDSGGVEFYISIIVVNAPSIGNGAFSGCSAVVSIELCDSISSIGSSAFERCFALTSITIPTSTTEISSYLFYQCENLAKVTIHQYVSKISASTCFQGCVLLKTFNVSRSNINFKTDENMNHLISNDGHTLLAGNSGSVVVPRGIHVLAANSLNWRGVKSITFENNSELTIIQTGAFGKISVRTLNLPKKLERIENNLFFQSTVDTIIIPDSVTYLSDEFLTGITTINNLEFNNDTSKVLMEINGVIYNRKLSRILLVTSTAKSITIPADVESISQEEVRRKTILDVDVIAGNPNMSSFKGVLYDNQTKRLLACPGGKLNVTLAPTCTEITSSSFVRCLVQKIDMNGCCLKIIGFAAFNYCYDLLTMVLPPSVERIENYAFQHCFIWTGKVKLTSNLTVLGEYCFDICEFIDEIDLSDCTSITRILVKTFKQCGMKSIKLPNTVQSIYSSAFLGAERLEKIELPPDTNQIGAEAFSGCVSLRECVITSSTISTLSESLFEGSGLINFIVPDSITSIQSSCFQNCKNLTSITFGEKSKIQTISPNMIFGCNKLCSVEIPSLSLSQIHIDAFSNALGLQDIIIRGKEEHRDGYWSDKGILMNGWTLVAFPGGRTNHTIDGNIAQLASHAFYLCSVLKSLIFAEDCVLETIGDSTFYGCSSLQVLQMPPKLKSVEKSAFNGCSGLTSVSLGDSSKVTTLGELCFSGCVSLEEIDFGFDSVLESIAGSAFKGCKSLRVVSGRLPISLRRIGASSFEGCEDLILTSIPGNVTEIGANAFRGCNSLRSMTLPKSLSSIGSDSFGECHNLSTVYFCGGSNIAPSISLFQKTKIKFVYVSLDYKDDCFGNTFAARLLDSECNLPTVRFTRNFDENILIGALLVNFEEGENE